MRQASPMLMLVMMGAVMFGLVSYPWPPPPVLHAQTPGTAAPRVARKVNLGKEVLLAGTMTASPSYKLGQKIVITYSEPVPEGVELVILWHNDPSLEVEQVDHRLFVWSQSPGPKSLQANIWPTKVVEVNGETIRALVGRPKPFTLRFTIEGKAPDPPKPDPGPGPGPNPGPSDKTIARLVVVMDTDTDTQPENQKLLELRSGGKWSQKMLIIDKPQAAATKFRDKLPDGADSYPYFFAENSDGDIVQQGHIDNFERTR